MSTCIFIINHSYSILFHILLFSFLKFNGTLLLYLFLKDNLREAVTELVRWSIDRDSMEDKQRALLDLMPALKRDIIHQVSGFKLMLQPLLHL